MFFVEVDAPFVRKMRVLNSKFVHQDDTFHTVHAPSRSINLPEEAAGPIRMSNRSRVIVYATSPLLKEVGGDLRTKRYRSMPVTLSSTITTPSQLYRACETSPLACIRLYLERVPLSELEVMCESQHRRTNLKGAVH